MAKSMWTGCSSGYQWRGRLNATTYNDIFNNGELPVLCLALFCFNMIKSPCTQQPHKERTGFPSFTWKNLTALPRALTSTPSNTCGTNWNTDCEPGTQLLGICCPVVQSNTGRSLLCSPRIESKYIPNVAYFFFKVESKSLKFQCMQSTCMFK